MRLTDNLHPSIPSSALHCDASNSHTRKNLQRTSQCETNDTVLKQKWLEQEASTTFLLPLPPLKRRVPESLSTTLSNRSLPQGPVTHLCLLRSPVSTALSFLSRCNPFPLLVPDPVPPSSCLVSPPPQTLIFSVTTQKLFRPSVCRLLGLSVRDHSDAAVVSGVVVEDNQRRTAQTTPLTQHLSQIAFGHNRVCE